MCSFRTDSGLDFRVCDVLGCFSESGVKNGEVSAVHSVLGVFVESSAVLFLTISASRFDSAFAVIVEWTFTYQFLL